jgi:hypothetical protein
LFFLFFHPFSDQLCSISQASERIGNDNSYSWLRVAPFLRLHGQLPFLDVSLSSFPFFLILHELFSPFLFQVPEAEDRKRVRKRAEEYLKAGGEVRQLSASAYDAAALELAALEKARKEAELKEKELKDKAPSTAPSTTTTTLTSSSKVFVR